MANSLHSLLFPYKLKYAHNSWYQNILNAILENVLN